MACHSVNANLPFYLHSAVWLHQVPVLVMYGDPRSFQFVMLLVCCCLPGQDCLMTVFAAFVFVLNLKCSLCFNCFYLSFVIGLMFSVLLWKAGCPCKFGRLRLNFGWSWAGAPLGAPCGGWHYAWVCTLTWQFRYIHHVFLGLVHPPYRAIRLYLPIISSTAHPSMLVQPPLFGPKMAQSECHVGSTSGPVRVKLGYVVVKTLLFGVFPQVFVFSPVGCQKRGKKLFW